MSSPERVTGGSSPAGPDATYAEAVALGLHEVMDADERVFLFGHAFFGVTRFQTLAADLLAAYPGRSWDPPVAELGFVGMSIGAAISGLRPIVDINTASFIFQAYSQVANEAANIHYMSGGQTRVPVVFHVVHGLRGAGGAQHSHSPQAMLWNTPGLQIVAPSSPRDVRGLIHAAVESDNPVLWADHPKLFPVRGDVPAAPETIPFGVAEVKRAGSDVTVVATSYMVQRALAVAARLAAEGVSVEVVDPRTLVPLDLDTILASVGRTGRLVIVDECHRSCGVAAEIAARVAEEGFDLLRAPIRRVATLDVPIPLSHPLEAFVEPGEERLEAAIRAALEGGSRGRGGPTRVARSRRASRVG